MKTPINYSQHLDQCLTTLSRGAFLTTASNDKVNVMTIAWGSPGFIWRKPIFTIFVRPSRFSYQLLEASAEFTISIPAGDLAHALGICGSKSGRDIDKLTAAGLTTLAAEKIKTPILNIPGLHYECKVIAKQLLQPNATTSDINTDFYADGDHHVLYFGEIVASYKISD